jgi:hypothetical protein
MRAPDAWLPVTAFQDAQLPVQSLHFRNPDPFFRYAAAEIDRLHEMFTTYTGGMAQFPQWDVPFLKYGKAMQVGGSFPWGSSPWGDLDDVAPAPGTF